MQRELSWRQGFRERAWAKKGSARRRRRRRDQGEKRASKVSTKAVCFIIQYSSSYLCTQKEIYLYSLRESERG